MRLRLAAVAFTAPRSRNRDKVETFTTPKKPPPMIPPPGFDIKDFRQPVVTSLGVIVGFLLGYVGQWLTEANFALRGL